VDPLRRPSIAQIIRHKWIRIGLGEYHPSFISEMETTSPHTSAADANNVPHPADATSPLFTCDDFVVDQVASLIGVHPAVVRDSVVLNKCDDLSAIYHLTLVNYKVSERDQAPPLSPTFYVQSEQVTEIFNDAETIVAETGEVISSRAGRRHTLGPSGHAVPLPPSFPLAFNFKGMLPQTNLPLNLPLVSNHPFADFSVKDQDLLRAPQTLSVPGSGSLGRRASDCGAYSAILASQIYQNQAKEAEDSLRWREKEAQFQNNQAVRPRLLNYASADCDESTQIERYLGGRGGGKRHPLAGGSGGISPLPDSPRRRRTGLMTVMEKPPQIAPALLQEVETRIHTQRPISPINFTLNMLESSSSLPPLSPPPVSSPSKPSSLRQRRTGLTTVLETGKTVNGRSSFSKEPYSLHLPVDRYPLYRRLSEGAPAFAQMRTNAPPSLPSSTDQSPCEIKALQEEYMQLSKETRLSQDSGHSSSGYHSPQFLRPPSPPLSLTPSGSRRSSQTLIEEENFNRPHLSQDNEGAMSALYEDMYASHDQKSRRFSFPNSPSHGGPGGREKHSLTQHLQQLCLQQKLFEAAPTDNRLKGSITQGVPSLSATTTPIVTPIPTPGSTPKREPRITQLPLGPKYALGQSYSLDDSVRTPTLKHLQHQHSVSSEEYIQVPMDGSLSQHHPAICVTNVMGDEFKLIFTEHMEQ